MTWQAWSDGSCVHNNTAGVFKRGRGYGGWAAVVEHGSEGFVLRGRQPGVTSSRMELEGAFAALEAIPDNEAVVLHVDCTVLLSVRDAWMRAKTEKVDWSRWRDSDMWRKIAAEFDRIDVRIELVVKGQIDRVHQRCHSMANAEARSLYGGKPAPQRPRHFARPASKEKPLGVVAQFGGIEPRPSG